ncbi:MAG TPA: hypothetical protein VLT59_14365, partial [Steroidobacteraceae bacterium]|nr:hypothetical protein [Steroidobacteraceae bacterium]
FFRRDPDAGTIFATIIDQNVGGLETSGVDIEFDAAVETPSGQWRLNAFLTWVDRWAIVEPNGATIDYAGMIGGSGLGNSIPQWKALVTLGFARDALDAFVRYQYIDAMQDALVPGFGVPSRSYIDVGATYAFGIDPLRGLSIGFGIENLTDAEPPLFPSWQQANTDPAQYDVLGRRYYAQLRYRF